MAELFGEKLDRRNILRKAGSMAQLSYVRPFTYSGSKSDGIKAYEVSNGTGLDFTVLESKGLDIISMKYKGMNLNYYPKSGMVSPALVDRNGTEFMRSISGGLLYTCGLLNVGDACVDNGFDQIFHGRMKTTPADNVSAQAEWEGDDYVLKLSGEMREAAIFNDNLVLKRTISARIGDKSIEVRDSVENQGFEAQELMLLYHVNIGYPVLDEGARVLMPSLEARGKDEESEAEVERYAEVVGPIDGYGEQVFKHRLASNSAGITGAAVINDKLGIGVYIKYDANRLPHLVQWKSMRSSDYAMGIMPATCFVNGRVEEKSNGTMKVIAPLDTLDFVLEIGVLDGAADITEFESFVTSTKEGYLKRQQKS
ncbi:aldose 1-epimerase family protein [Paenibacillus nasutitermitis]|uniref:DUF4432 domain-containing protein n=1 Tax=Paenibacillus nasutitermitis TaxID=1652958 RepID=A0A916Z8P4_9BACL|nr:aldose 1-epimerase family protein [Paenibacillus nasutitermitis]GGD80019.1 DUF4432 domain-containing protein [Paenibacillus nasutitermitis]